MSFKNFEKVRGADWPAERARCVALVADTLAASPPEVFHLMANGVEERTVMLLLRPAVAASAAI